MVGCDTSGQNDQAEIVEVVIIPDSATLDIGEEMDFSAVALAASGDTVRNGDLDTEWWSTDSDVFTVGSTGKATGQNAGTAFCVVEMNDEQSSGAALSKSIRFVGRDSAFIHIF